MQSKMTLRSILYLSVCVRPKTLSDSPCWRGCVARRTFLHCYWECNLYSHYWNQYGGSLEKWESIYLKTQLTTVEHIPEGHPFYKNTCSTMFTAALFIIARNWKQHRCPWPEEWLKKMWHIYIMEYYSAVKKITSWDLQANGLTRKKNHPEWGNLDSEREIQYVITYKWILAVM